MFLEQKKSTLQLVKTSLSLCFCCLINIVLVGQVDSLISLKLNAEKTKSTAEKCSLFYVIGDVYYDIWELDSSIHYYNKSLLLAKENQDKLMESKNLLSSSSCYTDLSIPDTALLFAQKAMDAIAFETTREALIQKSTIHFLFGLIYDTELSNATKSLEHFILSLKFAEEAQEPESIIDAYIGLALAYSRYNYLKCVRYGEKGIKVAKEQNDLFKVAELERVLGQAYLFKVKDKEELKEGQYYLQRSLFYYQKNDNKFEIADVSISLSKYYLIAEKVDSAMFYAQQAYDLLLEMDSETTTLAAAFYLAEALILKGEYTQAEQLLDKHAEAPELQQNAQLQSLLYEKQARCYEYINQPQKALNALKLYQIASDLLHKQSWNAESNKLQVEFNTQWLEKEQIILTERNKVLYTRIWFYSGMAYSFFILLVGGIYFVYKLKKSNKLVEQQRNELEGLNSTKNRLFSIIAHDLRSPLVALQGISKKTHFLLEKNRIDDVYRLGHVMERSITDVRKLIDNLLNWALAEQGRFPFHTEVINLSEIIEDVVQTYQNIADVKEIKLDVSMLEEIQVVGDRNTISIILRNLTDNAIKFTKAQGAVRIAIIEKGNQVLVTIEDTGEGISENRLKKLFLLNKSKVQKGTDGEKGTGLGLVLCKELIEMNGGNFTVESELKRGTTFTLSLPANVKK